jgi:membrane protein
MKRFKKAINLIGDAGNNFLDDEGFKLSASLSYYTLFALGPVLLIIISLAGMFFGRNAVQGEVYEQLNGVVGSEAALQIQNIIQSIQETQASTAGAFIGLAVLLVAATTVFTEMQGSINFIWSVKAKPKKSWLKFLLNRLLSFSIILGLGFILLVSLIINALLTLLSDKLVQLFPEYTVSLFSLLNSGLIMVVITGLFAVIFKILPDATISWKDSIIGAILTATLFLIGKTLIGLYLGRSNLGIHFGAAASIVIILTWIYYSSMILYFGAEFTKVYALNAGEGIKPKKTAVFIIKQEAKEIPLSKLDT